MLEILGNGEVAWDVSGLTQSLRRDSHLRRVMTLLQTVLIECTRSCSAMLRGHVAGFPRDLLWVLLHNVHVRRRLIQEHPQLGELLNERATTQDDVELEWSCLVFLAGFKPEVETCLSRLGKADVLAAMRADPQLDFHLLTSTKSAYTYNQRAALQVGQPDRWNNGSRMAAGALAAEFAGRMHKAFAQLPGAHCSVRSHHAHGTKQEFS